MCLLRPKMRQQYFEKDGTTITISVYSVPGIEQLPTNVCEPEEICAQCYHLLPECLESIHTIKLQYTRCYLNLRFENTGFLASILKSSSYNYHRLTF